jgi:copper(I)-binding protein
MNKTTAARVLTFVGGMLMLGMFPGQALAGELAQVTVADAWARPSAGANGAGFFVLENKATNDYVLLRAEADVAKSVELHNMVMDGNIMRMRKLASVPLPAGAKLSFAPGGMHVMFIGLTAPLKAGTSFPLTLVFEHAGAITTNVSVQAMPPAAPQGETGSTGMHMQ